MLRRRRVFRFFDGKSAFVRVKDMKVEKGTAMPFAISTLTALFAFIVSAAMPLNAAAQTGAQALRDLSDHEVNEAQLRSAVASRTLTWLTGPTLVESPSHLRLGAP